MGGGQNPVIDSELEALGNITLAEHHEAHILAAACLCAS